MGTNLVNCKSCGHIIDASIDQIEMFEGMHWVCFHFAYEHNVDPDEPCRSRQCPTWQLQILRKHLEKAGENPDHIINAEVERVWDVEK